MATKGRHPITGAEIKILRTGVSISRDQKTLVYLTEDAEPSMRWARWQTLVSDRESLAVLHPVIPNYILLWNRLSNEDVVFWKDWISAHRSQIHLVFLSKAIAEQLGDDILQIVNVMCYSEMYDLYPFIELELTDSSPLLQIICAIATVFRYNQLYISHGCDFSDVNTAGAVAVYHKQEGKLFVEKLKVSLVPKIVLIQQYFQHPLARRNREIKECLLRNIQNPFIDEIHLLNEKSFPEWLVHPKIHELIIEKRLDYSAVFQHIKDRIPSNTIVAFSNSDIYLDSTLRHLYSISMKGRFLSLLRWDDPNMPQIQEESEKKPAKIFGPRPDSQDTWIVLSDDVRFDPMLEDFQIQFGKAGCDNALNVAMLRQRFLICNPAYTIKTYHIHLSAVRDYNPQDIVDKPFYLYIDPTTIQEYSVVRDLSKNIYASVKSAGNTSISRQIHYVNENSAATICSMLKREQKWIFNAKENNDFVYEKEATTTLYKFTNKFMSPSGLFYGVNQIYAGNNVKWLKTWETSAVNILSTTLHIPHLIATEFDPTLAENLPLYCLHYLAKVLRVRKMIQQKEPSVNPEFLICQVNGVSEFLSILDWDRSESKVNLVPYDEKLQYYAENLYVLEPALNDILTPIDIQYLRALVPDYLKADSGSEKATVVFAVDDDAEILSRAWIERIQETSFADWRVHRIGPKTPPKEAFQLVSKANVFIGQTNSLSWMWCMRQGSTVIEVMKDIKPNGESIHLAGIAGLKYCVVVAKREPIDLQREHANRDIHLAIRNFCYKEALTTAVKVDDRPKIIFPANQTGLHEHCGDTFREMVDLWAERGYVTVQHSSTTPYVWLGGIGSVLLYDRPTLKWLDPSVLYEFGLFGNCTPPMETIAKSSVWTFWPRQPKKVEEFATKHIPTYEERPIETIFLGKVENGVQMKNRSRSDWASTIEKWSMPVDSAGKAYAYSQEEYLTEISKAKFGLCLAGYGNKCNREIEYFALGTVPICAPEVDMRFYLNPPKEGLHYLRVRDASEVKNVVSTISPEKWAEMSRACRDWWLENASAEGMFRLTLSASRR